MTGNFLLCVHLRKAESVCMIVTPLAGLTKETLLLCTHQEIIFQLSSPDSSYSSSHLLLWGFNTSTMSHTFKNALRLDFLIKKFFFIWSRNFRKLETVYKNSSLL